MPSDLKFSEGVIGFGAGIFFIGYFLLGIPVALMIERWGARRWIARIMVAWGLITVLMAFIHTTRQFYVVRFLVGAAEAGFFPGVIVYLTREWIINEIQREKDAKKKVRSYTIWEAFRHRDVLLLTFCYFCAMTGSYGLAFWLPTIVKRLSGQSDFRVTVLAALPYVAAFITQQFNGWHSDRTQERRWHAAIPVFVCAAALAFAVLYRANLVASIALFVVAGGAFYGFQPCFWAVPTLFLSESAAAASIGLINSIGNLGGFVGPLVIGYLAGRTHSFASGLLYLVASLFASGITILTVGVGRSTPAKADAAS
jgi:MFS family permease